MRICFVTPELLPVWGGVGSYAVELARHLPKDIDIHVVTPMRESVGKCRVSTSDYDFSEYFGSNVHIHLVSKARDTFVYNANFLLACLTYVRKLARKDDVDLVHYASQIAGCLSEFGRCHIPAVTTIHTTIVGQRKGTERSGVSFRDLDFSEKATYLAYPWLRLLESFYFSRDRYYITVSRWMKQQILEQYDMADSTVFVVRNSVDTELFSPSAKREPLDRDTVLFTGRIIAAKGIEYLVRAIPRVLKDYPETLFMFIGAGDSVPYAKHLKDMGVPKENFAFLGYLKERSDLIRYYRASSIYVAPTLYENLPIRILEAMACGVPVVATDVSAIPEVIDRNVDGILVRPGSVDALVDAVELLLSDPSLRRKMAENARKKVLEKFDSSSNAIRTAEIYRKILDQQCPA